MHGTTDKRWSLGTVRVKVSIVLPLQYTCFWRSRYPRGISVRLVRSSASSLFEWVCCMETRTCRTTFISYSTWPTLWLHGDPLGKFLLPFWRKKRYSIEVLLRNARCRWANCQNIPYVATAVPESKQNEHTRGRATIWWHDCPEEHGEDRTEDNRGPCGLHKTELSRSERQVRGGSREVLGTAPSNVVYYHQFQCNSIVWNKEDYYMPKRANCVAQLKDG